MNQGNNIITERQRHASEMAAMRDHVERLQGELSECKRLLRLAESDLALSPREQAVSAGYQWVDPAVKRRLDAALSPPVSAGYHHQQPSGVSGCPLCLGEDRDCSMCQGVRT